MNHQLENKQALVTGGSRGIGAAIVKRLARESAEVIRSLGRIKSSTLSSCANGFIIPP